MQNIQDTAQLLSMFADENSKEKVNNIAQRFEHSVFVSATSLQGYIQSIQMKLSQLRSKAYGGDEQSLSNTITPLSTTSHIQQTPSQVQPATPPQQQQQILHPPQMPHVQPQELFHPPPPQQFTRRQVDPQALEQIQTKTVVLSSLLEQAHKILPFHKHILGEQNWLKFTTIGQMYHQHVAALQENQVVFLAEQIDQVRDHVEKLMHSVSLDTMDTNWKKYLQQTAMGPTDTIYDFPRNSLPPLPANDTGPDYMVNPFNLCATMVPTTTTVISHTHNTSIAPVAIAIKRKPSLDATVTKKIKLNSFGQACTNEELQLFMNLSYTRAWRGIPTKLPEYLYTCLKKIKELKQQPTQILFFCGQPNPDEWWVEHDHYYLRMIGIQLGSNY